MLIFLALDKFAADEASWRKRQAPLGGESIASVALTTDTDRSRMSMTNFFQKKSEYPDTLLGDSPEKDNQPVPLIDESSQCFENSTLSITDIQRAIKADNTQVVTTGIITVINLNCVYFILVNGYLA